MRKLALFIFGLLSIILFVPSIAWLNWAIDYAISGVDPHNVYDPQKVLFAFIGWFSIFTFINIKRDKDWGSKKVVK